MGLGTICCPGSVTICQNKCKWSRGWIVRVSFVTICICLCIENDVDLIWNGCVRRMNHSSSYARLSGLIVIIKSAKSQKSRWLRKLRIPTAWPLTARQLREFVLSVEAHPALDFDSWPGISPGGQDGYGAVFAKSRAAGLGIALRWCKLLDNCNV